MNPVINISESYIDYLFKSFNGDMRYPIKNNGFNLSFTKLKNEYIFIFRNVFPIKNIIDKQELVPGISTKKYDFIKNSINVNTNNISDLFIWDWINFYESNILFVGNIDKNLNIIPNKKISPYAIISPKYNLKHIKNNENMYFPARIPSEDYRLYNFNGKIFLIDSAMNKINQVYIKDNKINVFFKYDDICNIKISKNMKYTNNNNDYIKVFEKNWSLYDIIIKDNKEQLFSFFHDFGKNGIETVEYNPITKKCKKKIIIKYNENTFPVNNKLLRFSFGSSCIKINNPKKSGYIGVGHFKNELYNKKMITGKNDYEYYFYDLYILLNTNLKNFFKNKYKMHFSRQYYLFFFLYDNINNKFYISDFYLPICKYKYIFSLFFPISINKVDNNVIISGGYGDYTNMLIKLPIEELIKNINYDVTNINLSKIKLKILYQK
jgi:hypothetical protein